MTGGAIVDKLFINTTTGFPQFADDAAPGLNTAINGNPRLPGETPTSAKCETAVSVFSVDYDAPTLVAAPVQAHLKNIAGKSKLGGH
jgi:5'-nucleotidase